MKLIKSIIRPNKVDEVKDALAKMNIAGMKPIYNFSICFVQYDRIFV